MDKYLKLVIETYKSLSQPDFSFVQKVQSLRPYEPLIKRLRDYAAIEDLPQAEEDVCFSYLFKGRNSIWKLDLSMLGPFGIFVRLSNKVSSEDFLTIERDDLVGIERKVVEMLHVSGIKLMSTDELGLTMPMNLYNTPRDESRIYHALFSDRRPLPWVE